MHVARGLALVEALRTWRRERAADDGKPAYTVFSDNTMFAIAERRPTDEQALLAIPGIGRAKLDSFGREVLDIVSSSA